MGDGTAGQALGRRPAVTSVPSPDALFFARLAAGRAALGPGIRIATVGAIDRPAVELTIEIFTAADPLRGDALLRMETLQASRELSASELEQWAGYSLDLFGAPLDGPLTRDGGPTWTIAWEDQAKPSGTTRLLRQWARYRDSPLRAQLLHLPGGTERASIERLRDGETETDLRRARAGIRLLRGLPKAIRAGGSPRGHRKGQTWSRRQCLEWWRTWADLDRIPTQAELADEMGVLDPETAAGRWRATGLHWPPTREELDEPEDD
jgi:hypothetical protein